MVGKLGFERGFHRLTLWSIFRLTFRLFILYVNVRFLRPGERPNVVVGSHSSPPRLGTADIFFPHTSFKTCCKTSVSWTKKISLLVFLVRFLNPLRVTGEKSYFECEWNEVFLRIISRAVIHTYVEGVYMYVHIWLDAFRFFHVIYLQKSVVAAILMSVSRQIWVLYI